MSSTLLFGFLLSQTKKIGFCRFYGTVKKTNENVKEKLLNSLRENDEDEDEEMKIGTVNSSKEVMEVIKHYEPIIKT